MQDIVIDTDNVLITGKGEVDLGPEVLDLTLNCQPKKCVSSAFDHPWSWGAPCRSRTSA